MTKQQETMQHPFTGTTCDVTRLQPGAVLEAGDLYRSATIAEDGTTIGPETPGVGRWYAVTDVAAGSVIAAGCNVQFMRLSPTVDAMNR